MSCRFLSDGYAVYGESGKKARLLEIAFHNGYKGCILVTEEPSGSFVTAEGRTINMWHFQVSADGKRITLTAQPSSSVKFMGEKGEELAHETVTDWPLEP